MLEEGMTVEVRTSFETLDGKEFKVGREGKVTEIKKTYSVVRIDGINLWINEPALQKYFICSLLERRMNKYAQKGNEDHS